MLSTREDQAGFARARDARKSWSHITVPRIFLLSPANLSGIRAGFLMRSNARSELANQLRNAGAPLGELFSFISGLYFRGKLAYARAFSPASAGVPGLFIITANAGLASPDTLVNLEQLREMSTIRLDPANKRYRGPLERDARMLLQSAGGGCEIVLLGSIASAKYVEPLVGIFGKQLVFPAEFIGRGDMSRGGLMLRCVESRTSLTYIPVISATRHGSRPAELAPGSVTPRSRQAEKPLL
jgi:hypothetical protein